jgi:hypothetical protein
MELAIIPAPPESTIAPSEVLGSRGPSRSPVLGSQHHFAGLGAGLVLGHKEGDS